jgi:hypothetical protein
MEINLHIKIQSALSIVVNSSKESWDGPKILVILILNFGDILAEESNVEISENHQQSKSTQIIQI